MSAIRCRRRYCGAMLDVRTDGMGRVVTFCRGCARNKRGLCRDCPARLADAHAMRCGACSRVRRNLLGRARDLERYPTRRAKVLAWTREYQARPTVRERRRQYMRMYKAIHQQGPFQRAYQREYMRMRRADPGYRDKQNARKRELRAQRRGLEASA